MSVPMFIALLYLVPLAIVFRTYTLWTENYPRLPEKVPVHFGLRGTPDRFWPKSPTLKYFFPSISLMLFLLMAVSFIEIPSMTDSYVKEIAVLGFFMTLSMVYLFYRISEGIIAVSLGSAKNMWPFMTWPLLLVLASSVAIVLWPIVVPHPARLTGISISSGMDERRLEPLNPGTVFPRDQQTIFAITRWEFLKNGQRVSIRWVTPRGIVFYEYRFTLLRGGKMHATRRVYSYISLHDHPESVSPGQWTVQAFLDGKQVGSAHFQVTP